ncbi:MULTISPECIES: TolC family outer membrane protein [unclassified Janthinobacterium]|uniref:TolC family outer membrane protein n=1 Tax=unclassified Janthinobacterium TaxID=2610881 RepID=UPI00034A42E1|nr:MULTISPECIES: TolC family outer membrane protein [unclassified Janthinobacterium]MEC5161651.1 outer membrane protein [Janthinobacterium sp. CG_S6]
MRKPLIAVLIASAFVSLSAQAADLNQVYQQALANDAQYASARAALAAGRERVPQGRAGLLPNVGLSGSHTRSNGDFSPFNEGQMQEGLFGDTLVTGRNTDNTTNTYNLTLSQPLFRWANWQQYQQSKLAQAAAEAQFAQVQQDLITRVAQAYFDVLTAQDNLGATQSQKTATTEQLASAKRNFEVGTQTITDTHEAQAAYDLVVAQEFAAINDLDNKRAALQTIIGEAPAALAPMRAGVGIGAPQPAAVEPWIASAEEQNYGVVTAQLALESAKRDIERNRAGHYPTVDLVANASRSNTTGTGRTNNNAIGVQWNVPLFSGFAVTSKVRESIALEDKARNDLETARRTASQGARQAYLGVNSGLAQVRALEAAEVSSKSALESNKLGYQVGVRINIDVLNAQKQLFATQKDLSKARYDTIINGLRLKSAAGTLKEADLATVNSLLQH